MIHPPQLWLSGVTLIVLATAPILEAQGQDAPAEGKWQTSAGAGATITSGNSDTLLFTANILSLRKWESNELSLGADGAYGENEGDKNNESLHGFIQYNRLFTERFYGYGRVDALHDAIADVEYRVTVSPGVGYYLVKEERTTLSGEFGPSVVFEKQGSDETTYFALRFGERFEHKLSKTARVWQSLEFLPQVDDWDNFLLLAEVGVESSLNERLSLRVFAQDTYDNEPAPGRDENDLKVIAQIVYKFQ